MLVCQEGPDQEITRAGFRCFPIMAELEKQINGIACPGRIWKH